MTTKADLYQPLTKFNGNPASPGKTPSLKSITLTIRANRDADGNLVHVWDTSAEFSTPATVNKVDALVVRYSALTDVSVLPAICNMIDTLVTPLAAAQEEIGVEP
jgi:hypothetical protein